MMKMRLKTIGALTLIVCFVYGARPFATDDAGTVEPGCYEVETGCDFWEESGILGLGFKHGLTEKMDLGIGFGYNFLPDSLRSFTNTELCLKYALIPDIFAVSFNTEFGSSSYSLNSILSRTFGALEFDANLGYLTGDSSITYASALIYSFDKFHFGLEVVGDKENQNWLLGGRFVIKEGLMIDGGFTSDFEFEEKNATFGVHYEF